MKKRLYEIKWQSEKKKKKRALNSFWSQCLPKRVQGFSFKTDLSISAKRGLKLGFENTLLMFLEWLCTISIFVDGGIFPQKYFETQVYVSSPQSKLIGQTQIYVYNIRSVCDTKLLCEQMWCHNTYFYD